eukprot:scaffold33714_cov211-Skeletonema_dohrnii-CCMP3373.AAC.1
MVIQLAGWAISGRARAEQDYFALTPRDRAILASGNSYCRPEAKKHDIIGKMNEQVAALKIDKQNLAEEMKKSDQKFKISSVVLDEKIMAIKSLEQNNEEQQLRVTWLNDEITETEVTAIKYDLEAILKKKEEECDSLMLKEDLANKNRRSLSEQIDGLIEQVPQSRLRSRGLST